MFPYSDEFTYLASDSPSEDVSLLDGVTVFLGGGIGAALRYWLAGGANVLLSVCTCLGATWLGSAAGRMI